jgi:hypothetical protein
MAATLDDVVKVNPMIVARDMDKGAILMNTMNGSCYELNSVGAIIWNYVVRGMPLRAIAETLASDYNIERIILDADIIRLVDDLASQGIVNLVPR